MRSPWRIRSARSGYPSSYSAVDLNCRSLGSFVQDDLHVMHTYVSDVHPLRGELCRHRGFRTVVSASASTACWSKQHNRKDGSDAAMVKIILVLTPSAWPARPPFGAGGGM